MKRDAASSELDLSLDLSLDEITAALLRGRGLAHKRDISSVLTTLGSPSPWDRVGGEAGLSSGMPRAHAAVPACQPERALQVKAVNGDGGGMPAPHPTLTPKGRESRVPVHNGDDCAAIPDGDGYLLFAIEGFVEDFVLRMPWFAGYCGVMVNVSDIYAMGGRPIAVVDALWSRSSEAAQPLLEGLAAASSRYGVPIVGGHTNSQSDRGQLAVSIVGRASRLLTSFDARPGDCLVMAIDLRGAYEEPHPYWNASTRAPAERLRADLEVLPGLAEDGLCDAAKDISMAGAIGTTLMLLECSRVGAVIDIDAIPHPDFEESESAAGGVPLLRWLQAFPSYGFVLSVRPDRVDAVRQRFLAREIACAVVGRVTADPQVRLIRGDETALLWDVSTQPLILPPSLHPCPAEEAPHA